SGRQIAPNDQPAVVDPITMSLGAVGIVENVVASVHKNRAVNVRIVVVPGERDISGCVDGMGKGVESAGNVEGRVRGAVVGESVLHITGIDKDAGDDARVVDSKSGRDDRAGRHDIAIG